MTDEELLLQFGNGHISALETLTYRYHAAIQTYIHRMMQFKGVAEDLTQECFIRVMTSARSGRYPQCFRPWIYKIATNLCRDHWRKVSSSEQACEESKLSTIPAKDNVSHIYEKQEERAIVIQALNQLSPIRKEIVILRFYQELKLDEISEILDIPLSTVKSRLYEAIRSLNVLLHNHNMERDTNQKDQRVERRKGKDG
ncbi:RNA polymerase sigma factor [Paenibacillus koleovorans]|uniref:RNA polymerase sigma factor n=1 Tax=Paenibacillus koleovorans TaxID=121608 RepID=UPI000FD6C6EA|nr:RNA polymerase sigma factor [Paenibacillus koleovorans]